MRPFMPDLRPATIPILDTAADDPRLGRLIGTAATPDAARVVLVGFPVDEGVRRNGGRPGAAGGPAALRDALYRLTPDPEQSDAFTDLVRHAADLGDLDPTGDLDTDQAALGAELAPHLARGAVAVVLGGGHETAYGHFLAYAGRGERIRVLNWDAHPDVRPLADGRGHSGSPFRQMLEHSSGACAGYTVAGLNPPAVARAHLEYLTARGGAAHFNTTLNFFEIDRLYAGCEDATQASFDLDAVEQAAAPGVSAPTAGGLSVHLWLHAAYAAGRCSTVRSIDVVELCPPLDPDGRTARLAARTVWEFLRGLAGRPG
jgi:formiminoglutamase